MRRFRHFVFAAVAGVLALASVSAERTAPLTGEQYSALNRQMETLAVGVSDDLERILLEEIETRCALLFFVAGDDASRTSALTLLETRKEAESISRALRHSSTDIRLEATISLRRLKDPKALPFVLQGLEDSLQKAVQGSERATLEYMLQRELAELTLELTGIPGALPKHTISMDRRQLRLILDEGAKWLREHPLERK